MIRNNEVLARLLELNEQRHKEELLVAGSQLLEKKSKKKTKRSNSPQRELGFENDE